MSEESSFPCSHCGALAKQRCSGCKATPYCNKTCQTEDWPSHRKPCHDLRMGKIVERAANTLQKVYFTFREQTFERNITKVERQGEDLVIWEDKDSSNKNGRMFAKFPTDLVKDYYEYAMVLSCENCIEPIGQFYDLVQQMLPDKNFQIAELHVMLKGKRVVKVHYTNPNIPSLANEFGMLHTVFRITSRKTKKSWCIDVTGPEHGVTDPFWEWTEFRKKHVVGVLYVLPFGQLRKYMTAVSSVNAVGELDVGIGMRAAAEVNRAMASWCTSTGMTMFQMLQDLDDNSFAERQEEALATVCNTARNYVETSDFSALAEEVDRIREDTGRLLEWWGKALALRGQLLKPAQFAVRGSREEQG